MEHVDVVIVGAGLVGLAIARALDRALPDRRVVVLDKEDAVATHQSGRSSGVVHSGVYYRPGSLKARLCVRGRRAMEALCRAEGLPYRRCGKVIVAVDADEAARLDGLQARASRNGVEAVRIGPAELMAREPFARGRAALYVGVTGVADFRTVAEHLRSRLVASGVEVRTGAALRGHAHHRGRHHLHTTAGDLSARLVITAAGLHGDRIARAFGGRPAVRLIPFRGEYWALEPGARVRCRTLIYPVPDPSLPFLGVHLTRGVHGEVLGGPNAVPALAREGYSWSGRSARDLAEVLAWPGTWGLGVRHGRTGVAELARSVSRRAFARALQRLVPSVEARELRPAPAGVRAQAVDRWGRLVDDFVLCATEGALHVVNAPSPAATASLALGEEVVRRALAHGRSVLGLTRGEEARIRGLSAVDELGDEVVQHR